MRSWDPAGAKAPIGPALLHVAKEGAAPWVTSGLHVKRQLPSPGPTLTLEARCPLLSDLFPCDLDQMGPVLGLLSWFLPQVTGSTKAHPLRETLPLCHGCGLALRKD